MNMVVIASALWICSLGCLAVTANALQVPNERADEISRLIKELPVEHVGQPKVPNDQIFSEIGNLTDASPVRKLARIGRRAVPQLVAALSDDRLSHTEEASRRENRVLRVREIALEILDEIAGRHFGGDGPFDESAIRAEISKWFADTANGGELASLKERLSTQDNSLAVSVLYRRYPSLATAAVGEALCRPGFCANPGWLIYGLGKHPSASATQFLTTEVKFGADLYFRLDAAYWLAIADPKTAAKLLVKEFHRFKGEDDSEGGIGRDSFIEPMLDTEEPLADECLFNGLAGRSINFRSDVVSLRGALGWKFANRRDRSTLERLLASELMDETTERCVFYGFGQPVIPSELGDIAAYSLSKLFPDKYPYHPSGFRNERRIERATFLNIWRRSRGLPFLPIFVPEVLHGATSSSIVSVQISGEKPAFKTIADLARSMVSKPIKYEDFLALCNSASGIQLSKHRYIRILASRDALGQGITLRVDFNLNGIGRGGGIPPQPVAVIDIRMDGHHRAVETSWSEPGTENKKPIEECLASNVDKPFDIEVDLWWRI